MVKAVMDLYTILEGTEEIGSFSDLLKDKVPPTLDISEEEEDTMVFALCEILEDRIRDRIAGEMLTAARLKEIVHEAIEEMRQE